MQLALEIAVGSKIPPANSVIVVAIAALLVVLVVQPVLELELAFVSLVLLLQQAVSLDLLAVPSFYPFVKLFPVNIFPFPEQYNQDWRGARLNALIPRIQLHTAWQSSITYHLFVQYECAQTSPFSRFIICSDTKLVTKLFNKKRCAL